jgi:serine/threonine protein kinase
MGCVYLARRLEDQAEVAIKVILGPRRTDASARGLFEREIRMQTRLRGHPHCVPLLAADLEGSSAYFVMEYCPGGSVDGLMARHGGRLSWEVAKPVILDALDGLAYAHSQYVVHRDLKPQNLLLTKEEGGTCKLTDFGLAKDYERVGLTDPTSTGDVGGNLLGMPREQVLDYKNVRPISDVWGMAATLYFMLTATPVRDFGEGRDPINVILSQDPVPIRQRDRSIAPGLAAVIDRALSDDLSERHQSAKELLEDLDQVM